MKVLQVLYSGLGGHASVVFSLVDGDRQSQWNHSLLFYGIEPLNKEYEQKATARGLDFAVIKAETGKPWRSWKEFYRRLENANPDLILLHSNNLLIPAWWYCKRHKKKLVTIEHTPNQVKRSIDKWVSVLSQYLSTAVILLTKNYQEELKKMLGRHFQKGKTVIIPNGIDTGYFMPVINKERSNVIKLGMAARFSYQKDQALLIEVIEKLEKENKGSFQLWLAGEGEELQNVKKLARDREIEDRVLFTGNLDEAKLLSFYQQLDIYLHASKGETMSTTIMQAMACGLPVVASDIPGINNLISGSNGILVKHNSLSFVNGINQMIESPGKIDMTGVEARMYSIEEFSHLTMFYRYNSLIRKISGL